MILVTGICSSSVFELGGLTTEKGMVVVRDRSGVRTMFCLPRSLLAILQVHTRYCIYQFTAISVVHGNSTSQATILEGSIHSGMVS